ncbi:MAG: hypothetical protein JRE23_00185 [Deltaproteobacteria bacterium]|nr:hypothetical protein [Deltaproteobacteria bacterium]
MSFTQKILISLSDQIDTPSIEHKNVFEGEGDRVGLASIIPATRKLLVHCDGDDGSPDFPDASASNHIITAVGGAQVDTAIKKFDTGSLLLNGGGARLNIPTHSDLNWAAEEFNFEFQVYSTNFAQANGVFYSTRSHSAYSGVLLRAFGKKVRFLATIGGTAWDIDFTSDTDLVNGMFNHLELSRAGDVYRIFQEGIQTGTQTKSGAIQYPGSASLIGGDAPSSLWFGGSIDEIAMDKGVPGHTSNFTPPTAAYPTYSDASPSPAAIWTAIPVGAELDMSTLKCWMFKDGVIQAAGNTDVKFKYAANNGALGSSLTLAALRAEGNPTITDDTNSFKVVGVYASDGTYESKSRVLLEVDATFPDGAAGGGGLQLINRGILNV